MGQLAFIESRARLQRPRETCEESRALLIAFAYTLINPALCTNTGGHLHCPMLDSELAGPYALLVRFSFFFSDAHPDRSASPNNRLTLKDLRKTSIGDLSAGKGPGKRETDRTLVAWLPPRPPVRPAIQTDASRRTARSYGGLAAIASFASRRTSQNDCLSRVLSMLWPALGVRCADGD